MKKLTTTAFLLGLLFAFSASAASAPAARVERYHGEPAIVIGGRAYPPMMMTYWLREATTPEWRSAYFRKLGAAGFRLFYVSAKTDWHTPGSFETMLGDIRMVLGAVPDAYVLLRLNVGPNREWVNARPEEQIRYSDGKPRACICTSVSREPLDGMHSLSSEKWRTDCGQSASSVPARPGRSTRSRATARTSARSRSG